MKTLPNAGAAPARNRFLVRNVISGLEKAEGLTPCVLWLCEVLTGQEGVGGAGAALGCALCSDCPGSALSLPFPIPCISEDYKPPDLVLISMQMFWSILN